MKNANAHGPARSPILFDTCRADSANADAHWLTACSLAPAQIINTMRIQNTVLPESVRIDRPSSSSASVRIGTTIKYSAFASGTAAQITASICHLSMPNMKKNAVERITTPICPQQ